ncbi:hypothetical protein GCM10011614_17070 [Novosphingobium colocasiae]|uniref:Uncharacterized protein n=2 Tax=Novosphingobium colocasiae TaxID=1256513 RepID=A0A918UFV4_9SPHN|nr:hypothetical protein GCM10011614_17070 [Novosphingobium colocasiae]
MVFSTIKAMVWGDKHNPGAKDLSVHRIPVQYRARYVTAIFAFLLSDTYRCALFGRVVRSAIPWLKAAIQEVKPDVNAHATQTIVERVSEYHPAKRFEERELAVCA